MISRDWIMTASGRPFWPLEPRDEDIAIEDIAHHLAHLCRFSGATRLFYSVAQHSVLVSRLMAPTPIAGVLTRAERDASRRIGLYGLLHDAAEAYLLDVPSPLKRTDAYATYRAHEARLQSAIYRRFDLDPDAVPPSLKDVDRAMLRTEQRDLMPPPAHDERRDDAVPFSVSVARPWDPRGAKFAFLDRYCELTGIRVAVGG